MEEDGEVKPKAPPMKCRECKQLLDDPDLRMFPGDTDSAVCFRFMKIFVLRCHLIASVTNTYSCTYFKMLQFVICNTVLFILNIACVLTGFVKVPELGLCIWTGGRVHCTY